MPVLQAGIGSVTGIDVADRYVRNAPATTLKGYGTPPKVTLLWTDGYLATHTRYGRRGAYPLFHISDGVTTASQEVFGGPRTDAPANYVPKESRLELVGEFDLHRVLDLTDAATQSLLGITEDEITVEPNLLDVDADGRPHAYELTQCIGAYAYAC